VICAGFAPGILQPDYADYERSMYYDIGTPKYIVSFGKQSRLESCATAKFSLKTDVKTVKQADCLHRTFVHSMGKLGVRGMSLAKMGWS
jgi:hypothetical protein